MKYCPNGHEVSDTVKYCPQCGAEIQNEVIDEIRFCKKCGYERKETERFCSHCGNPFNSVAESSRITQTYEDEIRKSSSNKLLLSLLFLVPILFVGGYLIYNHVDENKRLEKIRVENNEKAAEAERKRIEEENKLDNKFYNLLNSNQNKWIERNDKNYDRIWGLYFYPVSKNSGTVSLVYFHYDFSAFSQAYSCKVPYTIQDNYIIFTARYNRGLNGAYEFEDYMLEIQPTDNNVMLVRNYKGKTQVFNPFTKNLSDPIRNY